MRLQGISERLLARVIEPVTDEVDLIISAVPTPVLIADYTPIIERFEGLDASEVRARLVEDEAVFYEVLSLPRTIATSPEWDRLYGSPLAPDPPDLADRSFTRSEYPELYETLLRQFTSPFTGTTSLVSEHKAPTVLGDVIVKSHWRALARDDEPRWDRIVIVDFDVTEFRGAQRDLQELLETKEELVRLKDRLIASVAHEIRNPLSSIVGFAEVLRDASALGQEERQELIEMVARESADLTNIVDDLTVAAKSDLGKLEVSRVTVDLKAQAAQAVESMDPDVVGMVVLPEHRARCAGDPARVRQIVRNLVSNAVKYGGPDIRIETRTSDEAAHLVVEDNGPGIPEDCRARIFDAYERGDQGSHDRSLGLGLHISRDLARRMGGNLTYRYEAGRSVFELSMPPANDPTIG